MNERSSHKFFSIDSEIVILIMNKTLTLILSLCLIILSFNTRSQTIEVNVVETKSLANDQVIDLSGSVVAINDAQLSPLQAGLVKEVLVDAGDEVTEGQSLVTLDDTLARLRWNQAKANESSALIQYKEAQRQMQEVERLAKSQLVQQSLLDERKANVENAKANLANAKSQVELQQELINRHLIKAPFDGVIAQRNVDLGEWVSQQSQVFHLVSHRSLRLIAELPQEHLSSVSSSEKLYALVTPDVMTDKSMRLPVTHIVRVSDPISRTVELQIDLPETSGVIAGMSARAQIQLSNEKASMTWIPRSALKRHPDGGHSAFTVKSNRVQRHNVKIIKSESQRVAVSGLPEGSRVVVSGTEMLKDRQDVVVKSVMGNF
jgi:RND family efflux transporter MFP subunit